MAEDLRSDETKFWHDQIAKAVAAERESCAKIADDWLEAFGKRGPTSGAVSAQTWANDAVRDLADEIRKRP